jgi:hypothetical protein
MTSEAGPISRGERVWGAKDPAKLRVAVRHAGGSARSAGGAAGLAALIDRNGSLRGMVRWDRCRSPSRRALPKERTMTGQRNSAEARASKDPTRTHRSVSYGSRNRLGGAPAASGAGPCPIHASAGIHVEANGVAGGLTAAE